jgi:hypothetical protein
LTPDGFSTGGSRGRNAIRMLFCLLIAFVLWLFNTLSHQHEDTIYVALQYRLAANKINTNRLPDEASLQVRASGWQLLKESFFVRALELDLGNYTNNTTLVSNLHKELFSADMPTDIEILHVMPDTMRMEIEGSLSKKVPVFINFKGIKEHNWKIDSLVYRPDSITITGPESIVGKIDFWSTEAVYIDKLNEVIKGVAPLEPVKLNNIKLSAVAASYGILVYKDVAHTFSIDILLDSATGQKATIIINCIIPSNKIITIAAEDFEFEVKSNISEKGYNIFCIKSPPYVQNITLDKSFIPITEQE